METSESINELAAALAAAQGELKPAPKTAINAAFARGSNPGSKYATLADCATTALPVLSKHKLAWIQGIHGTEFFARLVHASGQWIQVRMPVPGDMSKMTIQQLGAIQTYLRRQSMGLIGLVADEDDDGNEAAKVGGWNHKPIGDVAPSDKSVAYADAFKAALPNGPDAVQQVHADLHGEGEEEYRAVWSLLDSKTRSAIKKVLSQKEAA